MGSKAEELGLRRGDEIMETNGQSFKSISLSKAFEILRGATHLFLTVKCNFLGKLFKSLRFSCERTHCVNN